MNLGILHPSHQIVFPKVVIESAVPVLIPTAAYPPPEDRQPRLDASDRSSLPKTRPLSEDGDFASLADAQSIQAGEPSCQQVNPLSEKLCTSATTCTGFAALPINADEYAEVATETKPFDDGGYYEENAPERLDPEDAWTVINSFFADKGLVRQQLESFNEFVENSVQEIVEERGKLVLDQYPQYNNEDDTVMVSAARDLGNRRPGKSGR